MTSMRESVKSPDRLKEGNAGVRKGMPQLTIDICDESEQTIKIVQQPEILYDA